MVKDRAVAYPRWGRVEWTVMDITQDGPEILREGAVSREDLEKAIGQAVRARA